MAKPGDIEHFMGNHSVPTVERIPWWDELKREKVLFGLASASGFDVLLAVMDPRPNLNTAKSTEAVDESQAA